MGVGAYWLQNTSIKVQPSTIPGPLGGEMTLEGPRDSVQSYQIVLRPSAGGMNDVNVTAAPLTTATGATIAASNITIYREFFIDFGRIDRARNAGGVLPAPEHSPTNDSRVPDPLIPLVDPYSGRPAGAPSPWTRTRTCRCGSSPHPEGRCSGDLHGATIAVSADGQPTISVPVVLQVWDLTLPDSRSVTTSFPDRLGGGSRISRRNERGLSGKRRTYAGAGEALRRDRAFSSRRSPEQIWLPSPSESTPPRIGPLSTRRSRRTWMDRAGTTGFRAPTSAPVYPSETRIALLAGAIRRRSRGVGVSSEGKGLVHPNLGSRGRRTRMIPFTRSSRSNPPGRRPVIQGGRARSSTRPCRARRALRC